MKLLLLVVLAALLPAFADSLGAAPRKDLAPACQRVDYGSAQHLFECVGTLPSMIYQEMQRRSCSDVARSVRRDLGREDWPSCQVLAEVSVMMTGEAPAWVGCLDYPGADPQAHMQRCLAGFAPVHYGERAYKRRLQTCEDALHSYEQALKASRPDTVNRVPDNYQRLPCEQVHRLVAELTGQEARYLQCVGYEAGAVREHLLRCLTSRDELYLNLRNCPAVRVVYEERLRATHGGLPADYRPLPCSEAQAVLDKAIAERDAQQQRQLALAGKQEAQRLQAEALARERLEKQRAEIRARQAAQPTEADTCNPGPNRYPKLVHGEILTALQTGCVSAIPATALLFLGGLAELLVSECRLPPNSAERLELAMFIQTAQLAAAGGSQYSNPRLQETIKSQAQAQQAYLLGLGTFHDLGGCDSPAAGQLASGLLAYLRASKADSPWIDGCEVHYAGRYTRQQCACVADHLLLLFPDIHTQTFSRSTMSRLIESQPLVALQLGIRCQIGNY